MKTAIIYARASTKEQSTKIQVRQLKEWCSENGYEINGIFEENVSGAAERRESLDTIISSDPMADVLVIREISRLSREKDYISALSKVNELVKKYTIHILADNYTIEKGDVLPMNDGILLIVKLYGAADEREKIAIRTTEAKKRYREDPINSVSGGVPFGLEKVQNPNYVKGVNTRMIYQKGKDWDTVLKVFQMKGDGLSYDQVALQTGLSRPAVRNIIRNKRIRFFLPSGMAERADRSSRENDSSPNPTRHDNKFKGIIFKGDTEETMRHQATSKGNRYVASGTVIREDDLNVAVVKAIRAFLKELPYRKSIILDDNRKRIDQLTASIETSRKLHERKVYELSTLRKKALKTSDMGLYEEIQKKIKGCSEDIQKIADQIDEWKQEIRSIERVYTTGLIVEDSNIETYVRRYVKSIRCTPGRKFSRTVSVELKDEYSVEGFPKVKEYEVYRSSKGHWVREIDRS